MSLHSTRNTLAEAIRRKSVDLLSQSLVTAIDVQRQAKQAHWNVKGPNFIALHLLFDEVHTAAIEWADLSAERLVALGGTADGRVEHVADKTQLLYEFDLAKVVPIKPQAMAPAVAPTVSPGVCPRTLAQTNFKNNFFCSSVNMS